ncbi:MAG: hypothetical protein AAF383_00745 [Cyanobacteria bacterium P01_A01_bin.83]
MSESENTLKELQKQALKLPISDRWQLVQTILSSIQQKTQTQISRLIIKSSPKAIAKTQSDT